MNRIRIVYFVAAWTIIGGLGLKPASAEGPALNEARDAEADGAAKTFDGNTRGGATVAGGARASAGRNIHLAQADGHYGPDGAQPPGYRVRYAPPPPMGEGAPAGGGLFSPSTMGALGGALVGGVTAAALGASLPWALGIAAVGGLAGWLVGSSLSSGNTTGALTTGGGALAGGLAGASLGGPLGAVIGTGVGALAGFGLGKFFG